MANRFRDIFDRQTAWIAGISILVLALMLVATIRLLLVEAVVPSHVWLDELRRLDTKSTAGALVGANFAGGLERAIADPSFVHNAYAGCVRDLKSAEESGVDDAYSDALRRCLAAVDQALLAAPAQSDLWLERVRLLLLLDGSQEESLGALRNSYRTGPREGWIGVRRIPIALRLWADLPDDLRAAAREDLRLAMTKTVLINAVAATYIKDFSVRTQLVDLLEGTDDLAQQRFLEAVKRLRETAGGTAATSTAAGADTTANKAQVNQPQPQSGRSGKVVVTAGGEAFEGYPIYRLLADGAPIGSARTAAATLPTPPPPLGVQMRQIRDSLTTSSFEVANIDQVSTLEIEFLNDNWAGEGKTGDRNLWIGQISVNGTVYPARKLQLKTGEQVSVHGGMAVLYRNGSAFLPRPSAGWEE